MSSIDCERIIVLGNWHLCVAVVTALEAANSTSGAIPYQITVLTYPSQTFTLQGLGFHCTVTHRKSDFSIISLQGAFRSQDVIISTMSGGDVDLQRRIIDAALAAGVKRFIPHEFGHDTLNSGIQARVSKYAGRAKVLDHLKAMSNAHSHFEWVAIATGYTLDVGLISGDLGFDMEWHSATLHGAGSELFAVSSLKRVAATVQRVIKNWEKLKNNYIYAAGALTSANEILKSAERVTTQDWTIGNYDIEDCIREGESRIERGFPDAGMTLLERSILYDEDLNAWKPFKLQDSNPNLQLLPESVDEIVEKAYQDLKDHGKPGCGCSS